MTIPDDDIRTILNLLINSMDFGSGFLCDEDVIAMRRVARALGMDPDVATPKHWDAKSHGAITVENDHVASSPDIRGGGFGGRQDEPTVMRSWCLCGHTVSVEFDWSAPRGYSDAERKVGDAMVAHVQEKLEEAREG